MPLVGGPMSSTGKDDWVTPPAVLAFASGLFGRPFDLDAAALTATAQAPAYFGPDHEDPTRQDALSVFWCSADMPHPLVWCNPPYSREAGGLDKWCAKFVDESNRGAIVVALFFARTETKAWHRYVSQAYQVFFIEGRLSFIDPTTGKQNFPAPAPSCLTVWQHGYYGPPIYRNLNLKTGVVR